MSNEHPDMSGNILDEPCLCCRCRKQISEEAICGVSWSEELILCDMCAGDLEDATEEERMKFQ